MGEEIKLITTEINNLLGKNFSYVTLEKMETDKLLEVIHEVFVKLNILSTNETPMDSDSAAIAILEGLNKIKYSPDADIKPEDFREGILTGNYSTIKPILYWIFSNPKQVQKRAYLARYVDKIEIPLELLEEEEFRSLKTQYDSLVEEFWRAYNENKKAKKAALEAKELQQDIVKMEEDILKLKQRIEQQEEKLETIPNKESLFAAVRVYRNEYKEQERLEEQIAECQERIAKRQNDIKELQNKIAVVRAQNSVDKDPLEEAMNEKTTNDIILQTLPSDAEDLEEQAEALKTVLNEPEPTEEDIDEQEAEINKLTEEVKVLSERQTVLDNSPDNQIGSVQSQMAATEEDKRQVVLGLVTEQSKLSKIEAKISVKEEQLEKLVGGPILQGDSLKEYVSKLREKNVAYKESKDDLHALTMEAGIVSRTLDILKSLDPSTEDLFQRRDEILTVQENISDLDEARSKVKKLCIDLEKAHAETNQVKEELNNFTAEMQPFFDEYNQLEEVYDELTGDVVKQQEKLKADYETLQEEIKIHEEKWKNLQQDREQKEALLFRLSEDIINIADALNTQPTQKDILLKTIEEQKELKKNLDKQLEDIEVKKVNLIIIVCCFLININFLGRRFEKSHCVRKNIKFIKGQRKMSSFILINFDRNLIISYLTLTQIKYG